MDRGTWWAMVHGVTRSQTHEQLNTHTWFKHFFFLILAALGLHGCTHRLLFFQCEGCIAHGLSSCGAQASLVAACVLSICDPPA